MGLTVETKYGLHIGYSEGTIGYTEGYMVTHGVHRAYIGDNRLHIRLHRAKSS